MGTICGQCAPEKFLQKQRWKESCCSHSAQFSRTQCYTLVTNQRHWFHEYKYTSTESLAIKTTSQHIYMYFFLQHTPVEGLYRKCNKYSSPLNNCETPSHAHPIISESRRFKKKKRKGTNWAYFCPAHKRLYCILIVFLLVAIDLQRTFPLVELPTSSGVWDPRFDDSNLYLINLTIDGQMDLFQSISNIERSYPLNLLSMEIFNQWVIEWLGSSSQRYFGITPSSWWSSSNQQRDPLIQLLRRERKCHQHAQQNSGLGE